MDLRHCIRASMPTVSSAVRCTVCQKCILHVFLALSVLVSQMTCQNLGAPISTPHCEAAKDFCHQDTDCLHRLIYLHSTCVTGTCQPQCKTAVLNLYEVKPGRALLQTDLSCLASVSSDMRKCYLVPTKSPVHCTLARLICEADTACRSNIDVFEAECDIGGFDSSGGPAKNCSVECANRLQRVFSGRGEALRSCVCWKQDPLCHHLKRTLIDSCRSPTSNIIDNNTRKDKNNINNNNIGNTNNFITGQTSNTKNTASGSLGGHADSGSAKFVAFLHPCITLLPLFIILLSF